MVTTSPFCLFSGVSASGRHHADAWPFRPRADSSPVDPDVDPSGLARHFSRADAGTRTPDPFITSEVLYQLSYVGADADASAGQLRSPAPAVTSSSERPSSDSPCFSQKAGPMPPDLDQLLDAPRAPAQDSSSTALVATV